MAPRVSLYHMPMSHYCVCAERMLAFKGIRPELVAVPYHDKRRLIAATGQDYVPALLWDGRVVPWKEIPDFLEAERPQPTLFPEGHRGAAEALDEWGHLTVEERVWRTVVTRVPARLPDEQERWVFEEMQTRARGPWKLLESRQEEFRQELLPTLARIDRMLDGRAWVLGKSASLADFGIYGGLSPMFFVGDPIPDGLPRLAAWVDRLARLGTTPPAPAATPSAPARPSKSAARPSKPSAKKPAAPPAKARPRRR